MAQAWFMIKVERVNVILRTLGRITNICVVLCPIGKPYLMNIEHCEMNSEYLELVGKN